VHIFEHDDRRVRAQLDVIAESNSGVVLLAHPVQESMQSLCKPGDASHAPCKRPRSRDKPSRTSTASARRAGAWSLHYREPISENLFRRMAARVGAQCASADQGRLQEALKPRRTPPRCSSSRLPLLYEVTPTPPRRRLQATRPPVVDASLLVAPHLPRARPPRALLGPRRLAMERHPARAGASARSAVPRGAGAGTRRGAVAQPVARRGRGGVRSGVPQPARKPTASVSRWAIMFAPRSRRQR
jgi:hypothetical protein